MLCCWQTRSYIMRIIFCSSCFAVSLHSARTALFCAVPFRSRLFAHRSLPQARIRERGTLQTSPRHVLVSNSSIAYTLHMSSVNARLVGSPRRMEPFVKENRLPDRNATRVSGLWILGPIPACCRVGSITHPTNSATTRVEVDAIVECRGLSRRWLLQFGS